MSTTHASPLAPDWLTVPENFSDLERPNPPRLFPRSARRDPSGQLVLGGVSVETLARRYGTPIYVIDEDELRTRARAFKEAYDAAFSDLCGGADVYYAGKVLLTSDVVRWVTEEGLRIDTASGGEMGLALAAGANPAHIGLHGNNKSDAELRRAIDAGVGRIIADSLEEIERINQIAGSRGTSAPVMLRLTPGVHASTHEFIATAHEDQKFGLSMTPRPGAELSAAAQAVAQALEAENVELIGLHCHIGSQIFESAGFEEAARRLLGFIAWVKETHGVELGELDLGGGYGIAYTEADSPREPQEIATGIAAVIREETERLGITCPRISIEPGRSIAGPAGVTLYSVGTIKDVTVETEAGESAARRYVSVDGGMSDNARPVLYDADYSAILASRTSHAPGVLSRVVGKHCESGDIVVRDVYLPNDVMRGDILAVPATGAYCFVLSSNYNMLTRPGIVAVKDGKHRLIVRGETVDDLYARDLGLQDLGLQG